MTFKTLVCNTDAAIEDCLSGKFDLKAYDDGTWVLIADDGHLANWWVESDRLLTPDEIKKLRK